MPLVRPRAVITVISICLLRRYVGQFHPYEFSKRFDRRYGVTRVYTMHTSVFYKRVYKRRPKLK